MKEFILISVFLLLALFKSNGQISLAPKVGFNLSNFSGDVTDNEMRLRLQAGCALNAEVNELFAFQPGLIFNGKGTTFDWSDNDKDAVVLNYLEIPLNGLLNFQLSSGKFQIFAGPYLGICLNGKYKYLSDEENEVESIEIGNSDDDDIKPLDFGANIGLGYKIEEFQVQFGYSGSFISIANDSEEQLKNSLISISFSYFINL